MGVDVDEGFSEFVEYHQLQLKSIGLPEQAWRQVYEKLQPRVVYDLEQSVAVGAEGKVLSTRDLQPFSAVFVLPHRWTGDAAQQTLATLREALHTGEEESPLILPDRQIESEPCEAAELARVVGCSVEVAAAALVSANHDLIIAMDKITSTDDANTDITDALNSNLPAPPTLLSLGEFRSALTEPVSEARAEQMYQDYVRKKQREDVGEGGGTTARYRWEDDGDEHVITVTIPLPAGTTRSQITSRVRSRQWTFGLAGCPPIITGTLGGLVVPDECTWVVERGVVVVTLQKADTEVFLWRELIEGEERISADRIAGERELHAVAAMDGLWRRALTYQAVTVGGRQQYTWYLPPPEVSAMTHSKKPKLKLAPFWSCYGGKIITLLWPVRSVQAGEVCSLDVVPVLFTGETEAQREARLWCGNALPDSIPPAGFARQYENLLPPFAHSMVECREREISGCNSPGSLSPLSVATSATFNEACQEALRKVKITLIKEPTAGCAHWVEGRQDRGELTPVNSFDQSLTNLIQLNSKMREGGRREWWVGGYHLNMELSALLSHPADWSSLWVVRCAVDSAPSHLTNSAARLGRLCENSLNYFAQPFLESVQLEGCQCSLEFTLVSSPSGKWYISSIPAVHKARLPLTDDCQHLTDQYLARSDGGHLPSTAWSAYLLEFSLRSSWPDVETQVLHIAQDLLPEVSPAACYGLHFIVRTDTLQPVLIGVKGSPTYFPSAGHLAAALRLLYTPGYQPGSLFRRVH